VQNIRSPWIRYGCIAIIVLITAAFLFLDPIIRSRVKRDMAGAPEQQGVATVVILVIPDRLHTEGDYKPQVSVRFRGRIYSVHNAYEPEALKMDQLAQIEYRVGKSGTVIVDTVEPLPAGKGQGQGQGQEFR
jgi:hypothetical protein